jgi:protein TonB
MNGGERIFPWGLAAAVAGAHVGALCCLGLGQDDSRPAELVADLEASSVSPDEGPVPLPERLSRASAVRSAASSEGAPTTPSTEASPSAVELSSPSAAEGSPPAVAISDSVSPLVSPAAMPSATSGRNALDAGGAPGPIDEDGGGEGRAQPSGYLSNPAPAYPFLSRLAGEEGTVRLSVEVDTAGLPVSVRLARGCGHPRLDGAALAAVWGWRFRPARCRRRAVAGRVTVPVRFSLEEH